MQSFDHTNPKSLCSFSHRQESWCIFKKEPIQESSIEKGRRKEEGWRRKEEGGQVSPVFDVQKAGIQSYIPLNHISNIFPAHNSNTLREHLSCVTLTEQQKHSLAFLTCFLVMPLCAFRSLLLIESRQISANCTTSACDPLRLSQRPSIAVVSSGPLCAVLHGLKCVLSLDLGISTAQKLL